MDVCLPGDKLCRQKTNQSKSKDDKTKEVRMSEMKLIQQSFNINLDSPEAEPETNIQGS